MASDYTILAAPRISRRTFAGILERADSPAASSARDAYDAAVAYGVDPAVLLAVFRHESGYGRAGVARSSRSWGNLRRSPWYPTVDGFARYPTWEAGAKDTARLLRVYGKNQIRPGRNTSTCQTFPYVWAPSGDGNRPDAYGDALVRYINGYRALEAGKPPATHPTHRTPYADVVLRTAATAAGVRARTVPAGTRATVTGSVAGARWEWNGHTGTRWLRVVALNGTALPRPLYTAPALWVAL